MSLIRSAQPPLPPPNMIGAPDRFDRWRALQAEAVFTIATTDKRFTICSMPTGSGKSLVYTSAAAFTGLRTCILTSTKGLQEQLTRDFAEIGMRDIRGMGNYPCRLITEDAEAMNAARRHALARGAYVPPVGKEPPPNFILFGTGCDQGPCTYGDRCDYREAGCHYYDDLHLAQKARLVVTNYSYYLFNQNVGNPENSLGKFDLLVLDEAHDAPDQLAEFLRVELEAHEIENLLQTRLLDPASTPDQWVEWAKYHFGRTEAQVEDLKAQIEEYKADGQRPPKELRLAYREWNSLAQKLGKLCSMKADWVNEPKGRGMVFTPLWPAGYAESNLFRGIKKVVLVSATIRPKTADYLGIRRSDIEFIDYPSSFPLIRRPVTHIKCVQMNRRTEAQDATYSALVMKIDHIIKARQHLKGIIHTVSYARAHRIYQLSQQKALMFRPDSSNTRRKVEEFKKARAGVLISPAVTTGYDFPYDDCRFQIIVKLPFPDTSSTIMKARVDSDKEYSPYLVMQELIQMVGRGMRAEDDWCETFVLDDNINWFVWNNKQYAPPWFLDSISSVQLIPKPLEERLQGVIR